MNKKIKLRKTFSIIIVFLSLSLFSQGCDYLFPKKPKPYLTLTTKLPEIDLNNRKYLNLAIERQLNILERKKYQDELRNFNGAVISQDLIRRSLIRFRELLNSYDGSDLRNVLLKEFDVYKSAGCKKGKGLFTAYYTPLFEASVMPTEEFQYPLYRFPDNYQLLKISSLRKSWENISITVYVDDEGTVRLPPTRREIENNKVHAGKGLESVGAVT